MRSWKIADRKELIVNENVSNSGGEDRKESLSNLKVFLNGIFFHTLNSHALKPFTSQQQSLPFAVFIVNEVVVKA